MNGSAGSGIARRRIETRVVRFELLRRSCIHHHAGAWNATWENNTNLARLADRVGLDCIVPVARCKGFGGQSNVNGSSFETITWAAGLLAATGRIVVFGTIHVQLMHSVLAAKQFVTVDHIGHGRLGVNIVCGWNRDEFRNVQHPNHAHDARYESAEDWWSVVISLWSRNGSFDHQEKYFSFKNLEADPKPYVGRRPL